MKKKLLAIFLITVSYSQQVMSQNLDIKSLTSAYNSSSIQGAFEILKKVGNYSDKVFLGNRLGDSIVIVRIGSDSLTARKQGGKIIIICHSFNNESIFLDLKQQAAKSFKYIETTEAKDMGEIRKHYVYGIKNPLKMGDLRIILTLYFNIATASSYYGFTFFPYY